MERAAACLHLRGLMRVLRCCQPVIEQQRAQSWALQGSSLSWRQAPGLQPPSQALHHLLRACHWHPPGEGCRLQWVGDSCAVSQVPIWRDRGGSMASSTRASISGTVYAEQNPRTVSSCHDSCPVANSGTPQHQTEACSSSASADLAGGAIGAGGAKLLHQGRDGPVGAHFRALGLLGSPRRLGRACCMGRQRFTASVPGASPLCMANMVCPKVHKAPLWAERCQHAQHHAELDAGASWPAASSRIFAGKFV